MSRRPLSRKWTQRSATPGPPSAPGVVWLPLTGPRMLRSFAEAVDRHREELAQLEVRNSGHTIGNARWEAGNVRDVLNYYSAAPERLFGRQNPGPGRRRHHLQGASRGRGRHRPLELPDADRRLGFCSRLSPPATPWC